MTISEQLARLEAYTGASPCPDDFADFWRERDRQAAQPRPVERTPVELPNPCGSYWELRFPAVDGTPLLARYLCPASGKPAPTVLMFHDADRAVRGWHHMTRFLALGFGVVALENRSRLADVTDGWRAGPEGLALTRLYTDALTAAHAALTLPGTDPDRLIAWGEGLGGGMAVAVSALLPGGTAKCAALNPLPADFRRVWQEGGGGCCAGLWAAFRDRDPEHREEAEFFRTLSYVDGINFAPLLRGRLHMGTALLDRVALPAAQFALFNRAACAKEHIVYPKYEHERINVYENELLNFLHD